MFYDGRKVTSNKTIETDVCIVGAGAAGITMALELADIQIQVCLVESGGFYRDQETQDLYRGKSVGVPYDLQTQIARIRRFGGSTHHWASLCIPLDTIDFEKRSWIPYSGWPFSKKHLDSYYERAQKICQIGKYSYNVADWETEQKQKLPFKDDTIISTIMQLSNGPAINFGDAYKNAIKKAPNIKTFLHSNVIHLEANEYLKNIQHVQIACLNNNQFRIKAKHYILAAGGLEIPRILLYSNNRQKNGLGNQNDLVGRFFMEHPHFRKTGVILLSDPNISTKLYIPHQVKNHKIWCLLKLSEKTLLREKLANYLCFLSPVILNRYDTNYSSLNNLRESFFSIDQMTKKPITKNGYSIKDLSYFSILQEEIEQLPNPESRITLIDEKDALGMNRLQLNWKISKFDIESRDRSREIIAANLALSGLGRMKIEDKSIHSGKHHMGTTRMHENPKHGVVDKDCKVHGLSNLFIASSSVFPTGGSANPTLTIIALAIRLTDHIKGIL